MENVSLEVRYISIVQIIHINIVTCKHGFTSLYKKSLVHVNSIVSDRTLFQNSEQMYIVPFIGRNNLHYE